jgi:hypothetical protein
MASPASVIEQTVQREKTSGFQRSEFLLQRSHQICDRRELRRQLALMAMMMKRPHRWMTPGQQHRPAPLLRHRGIRGQVGGRSRQFHCCAWAMPHGHALQAAAPPEQSAAEADGADRRRASPTMFEAALEAGWSRQAWTCSP